MNRNHSQHGQCTPLHLTPIQRLRHYTETDTLYRDWDTIQRLRHYTETDTLYRDWYTLQRLRHYTETDTLYRDWDSYTISHLSFHWLNGEGGLERCCPEWFIFLPYNVLHQLYQFQQRSMKISSCNPSLPSKRGNTVLQVVQHGTFMTLETRGTVSLSGDRFNYEAVRDKDMLTRPDTSRALASQIKCRNRCYSINAPTLPARVNERLRCQGLI